jgi:tetratricopeptide (TPR) repeat protein
MEGDHLLSIIYFVKQAQAAYKAGDFTRAVDLYERAIVQRPELAGVYRFNLEHTQAKSGGVEKLALPAATRQPGLTYLDDLYSEIAKFSATQPLVNATLAQPLVSVVMTAHNVADYIE